MFYTDRSPKSRWVRAAFHKLWFLTAGLTLAFGLARTVPSVLAATPTPTPTQTLPALPDPPADGGVVAVQDLTVYEGPGESFSELGGLPYGAFIYPQARTQDTVWLQIEYAGFEGWVYRPLINMAFDAVVLPVPPGMITPIPGSDNVTLTPVEGAAGEADVQATSAEAAQEATNTPLPSLTPTPEPQPAATDAPPAEEVGPEATQESSPAESPQVSEAPGATPDVGVGRVVLVAAALLGLVISGGYLISGRAMAGVQRGEFVVTTCPACGEGQLSLAGRRRSRVVRCDNCRSVLRQLRNGVWRYAVDPLPDEDFANQHNGQSFSAEELIELAEKRARQRATQESREEK